MGFEVSTAVSQVSVLLVDLVATVGNQIPLVWGNIETSYHVVLLR